MSHENESPALPPSVPRAEPAEDLPFHPDTPGHVMSPGTRVPRPQTMVGIGSVPPPKGSVPPAPPTEVVPAPAVRNDPSMSAGVKAALEFAGIPRPRPSETHVGATSPLHTAEDANTQVNLTSLSPADAGRILEAAEADKRPHARPRAPTLLATSAGLPPPPANRRASTVPPPSSGPEPPTTRIGALPPPPGARSPYPHMHAQTITHAAPPPPAPLRGSTPPPPGARRPNTLLFFEPIQEELAPKSSPVPGDGRSVRAAKAPVRVPTVRAGPPPVVEAPEELSSALLADDSAQFPAIGRVPKHGAPNVVPPQPISSSSLVEDPDSDPELQLEEDDDEAPTARPPTPAPPAAASSAPRVAPPDPLSSPFPDPPPPPLASPQAPVMAPTPMSPVAPMVAADPFAPVERLAITEPMSTRDPFTRPTDPPRLRDLRPDDSGRTYVAAPPEPLPIWSRPPVIIGSAVAVVTVAAILAFAFRSSTPTSEQPSKVATSPSAATSAPGPGASASPTASGTAAPATSAAATAAHGSESSSGSPCVLAGAPHVVAPHAIMKTGIETASNPDRLAFGVGVNEHEGLIVAIDPSTFAITATAHPKTSDTLHRVVPLLGGGSELGSFLEASHHHATIESAYPVAAEPPFVVGVAKGKLVWAASRTSTPEPLWPIDANVPVEVLRAVPLPKHAGYAVAFRQGTSLFLGALSEDKHVNGPIVGIAGLGPQVGAPTLAAGNDHVVVAWADRTSPSVPWGIRWVKWHPGSDPGEPAPFPVPNAAEGAAEMSPSITSLSGGRFVMAWTEATGAAHVVRAEALDATEHPIGTTLTVSAEGVNAGQGMPVFTPDGRGTVVFLATPTGATASVVAVPVICPGGA